MPIEDGSTRWSRRNRAISFLGLLAGVLFLYGVIQLFSLRFESGDFYPEYSSLRSDPLGTKVLFEALREMEGVGVERNFRSLNRLQPDQPDPALLILGMSPLSLKLMYRPQIEDLEALAQRGARIVITLIPLAREPRFVSKSEDDEAESEEAAGVDPLPEPGSDPPTPRSPVEDEQSLVKPEERWGFQLVWKPPSEFSDRDFGTARLAGSSGTGAPWKSGYVLDYLDPAWQTIASREGSPVIARRIHGAGEIVIGTDSFFLSNEALLKHRHTELLAGILGSRSLVVFEERHLGIREEPGVMTLIQRYRLAGFLVGLLLLGGLFAWRNSSVFLPAPAALQSNEAFVAGRDTFSGLVSLLRRNIPRDELLGACLREWNQSRNLISGWSEEKAGQIEALVKHYERKGARAADLAETYRRIRSTLARKGTYL